MPEEITVTNNENTVIFSIIIPVTRESELKMLLTGIGKQDFDLNKIEVILVNDRREEIYLDYPFKLQVLFSERNHPGIKRNIGCRIAQGRYYVFLDDDCYPPPDWVEGGLKLLQKHKVVCGPCSLDEGPFSKRVARAIGSSFFGSGNRISCNYKETEVHFYDIGFYNVFMHKDVWELAGGCNEEANFLMDDKEFFYLLNLHGIRFYNSPAIEVSHSARSFPIEFLRQSFRRKFQTGINFFVYNEIFRRQPIFYFIYASYFIIPLLFLYSWKLFLISLLSYYLLLTVVYSSYLKKDYRIYFCLPPGIILTNITMLIGILCGSVYFIFHRRNFRGEIIAEKRRIAKALSYA